MKILINGLWVLFLLFITGCKQISSKPKFTLSKPIGWTRKDTIVPDGNRVVYMANPKSTEEITIIDGYYEKQYDFMKFYMTELYKRSSSIEIRGDGDYKDKKKIIQWVLWRAKFNFRSDVVDQKTFFIPNGSYHLSVSFTNLPDSILQMQPIIEEVLNSIKFK